MDLTTHYLGLTLKNPVIAGASPLSHDLNNIRKMEDSGAAAVVLYSLFEEQIMRESGEMLHYLTQGSESFAEATTYFPEPDDYHIGPEGYLEHIRKAKEAVSIPVIASLNGYSRGGWTDYALRFQEAGADAIELNIYMLPTSFEQTSEQVELLYLDILGDIKKNLSIPVAIKLSPFFSSIPSMAHKLDHAGVNGLVLFNRFYQPNIDLERLEVEPQIKLSTSADILLPLRWIAILHSHVKASLCSTSGVRTVEDVIKMLMVGANATQVCALLLENGIEALELLLQTLEHWMVAHEYDSVEQMQGSMSHRAVAEPSAFERANYMKSLQAW